MALLKHTWTKSIRTDNGGGVADTEVVEADGEVNVSAIAPAGQTLEIDVAIDVTLIKSCFVESDQALTLNVNTNTTTSGAPSLALVAKRAVAWKVTDPASNVNPFNTAITKLYFNNVVGTVDANVKAGFLLDLEA
jgi:hypothetical protein